MELRVPLYKICYRDHRLHSKFALTDEQDLIPLFDEDEQQWNWALPMSHLDKPGIDRIEETGEGLEGNEHEVSGSGVSDSLPEGPLEAQKHPFEEIFASFFNTISGALSHAQPKVMEANKTVDEEIHCKPDLVLLDDVTAQWDTIKAVCSVVTPCVNIVSDPNLYLHILSCLVFGNLECLGYDPSILIFMKMLWPAQLKNSSTFSHLTTNRIPAPNCNQAQESLVESTVDEAIQVGSTALPQTMSAPTALDAPPIASTCKTADPPQTEIPIDPLCALPTQLIRKILVSDHTYDILELIFSSQGLVGRSTVCYLARRLEEEYIIKDNWVLGDKEVALNEVVMLQAMQGVHSVPQLVEYWLVETKAQEVDETMNYCGKIWQSITGTLCTHSWSVRFGTSLEIAVEERGILHRNCSLNNAMIEDDSDGSHGTLINWEFAIHILEGQKYAIGGTGTLPVMSCSLLFQLSEAVGGIAMSQNSWKHTSHSHAKIPPLIMHGYQDDLKGPLGVKCILEKQTKGQWLMHLWGKGPSHALTFKEVIDLLTKRLDILPKDKPSPELLLSKKVIDALPNGLPAVPDTIPDALPGGKRKVASEAADKDVALPPVMEHDMTFEGRVLWTMEPIPKPKWMRTT
ncbi:hypothetical protein EV702DRAFT_1050050 [Suillus placidus]|uniref:Fungal-type protein kinase domain-containing protein n=1 Tax=Suillus placidus TaxID=48579 RepID=A0A9P6ZIW7_9AGAM|nr:hypothetical protein EV702DRAFT_1050050 [Suillus placidus]